MAKRKTAAWYAIAIKPAVSSRGAFVVHKVKDPRISGGRYAFGPYKTKKKACQVGSYQNYGVVPDGCGGS